MFKNSFFSKLPSSHQGMPETLTRPKAGLTKKLASGFVAASLGLVLNVLPTTAVASESEADSASLSSLPDYIREKTQVTVSNYPLFLLSEAVTKGAPSAKLLLDAGDVGHHGSLSPGDIKTVKESRYVVWFGKELESNLVAPLKQSPNTISLFDIEGFDFVPLRDVKGKPIEGTLDPHMWLEPNNAKAITRALGAIYSRANPEHRQLYANNVRDFAIEMDNAVSQVQHSSSKKSPYWAYHDAFQYLEPTLNLDMVGALTSDHHLPPKASQFHWLKKTRPQDTMCIVLQSDSNQSVLSKLAPIQSSTQQEDMSRFQDFVSGWLQVARDINTCVTR